jgi:hypothetical protein
LQPRAGAQHWESHIDPSKKEITMTFLRIAIIALALAATATVPFEASAGIGTSPGKCLFRC